MRVVSKKINFILLFLWHCAVSVFSPVWMGYAYMYITGHGKGYSYDLGGEKDISIVFGIVLLCMFLIAFFPSFSYLSRKLYKQKKILAWVPILVFILLFGLGIYILGIGRFAAFFGLGRA